MKKKILITTSTFPRYKGDTTPSFVYDYARQLSEYFEVIVLCPFAGGAEKFEVMEDVKVYRYNYFGNVAYGGGIVPKLKQNKLNYLQVPFFLFFQLLNIIKLVKKYDIEVVHAHWLIPQGLAAVIYKLFFNKNAKVLCTAHGTDIYGLQGKIGKVLKRFVIKNSDKITCVSNALKNEILTYYKRDDIEVISMGIDTEMFSPRPDKEEGGQSLLFVGRLDEKKGIYYLINAMPEVLRRFPNVKLTVVGDGPEKNNLLKQVQDLNIVKNIVFKGAVPHNKLPEYYASADIFIMPSLREGFGLVCAEALSCGTPVIATNLPAIADIVRDNVNGLIVEQENSKMLAEKIIFMLENPDRLKQMGESGRNYVRQNFDRHITRQKYRNILLTFIFPC